MDTLSNITPSATGALEGLIRAAQADTNGAGIPHLNLLDSIQKYRLAVETPGETLMRQRLQVDL